MSADEEGKYRTIVLEEFSMSDRGVVPCQMAVR